MSRATTQHSIICAIPLLWNPGRDFVFSTAVVVTVVVVVAAAAAVTAAAAVLGGELAKCLTHRYGCWFC